MLDNKNAEWAAYIQTLQGEEQKAEEEKYKEVASSTATSRGYLDVLMDAQDRATEIEVRLEEIEHAIAQIESEDGSKTLVLPAQSTEALAVEILVFRECRKLSFPLFLATQFSSSHFGISSSPLSIPSKNCRKWKNSPTCEAC